METLILLCDRKELISLIKPTENSNLDHLYSTLVFHVLSKAFWIFGNTAAVDIIEIKGHVRKPRTLQCRAVTGTETKLPCTQQAYFFNVLLDYF
jgi:hypothetical protein